MPRSLVFSRGSLFIGIDSRYVIRELTYPHVGQENHLYGSGIRMGVWVSGEFSWCDSNEWSINVSRRPGGVGATSLNHPRLAVTLECFDGVDDYGYWRTIQATAPEPSGELRLFVTEDLRIGGSDIGDTALYDPVADAIFHFKGKTWIGFRLSGGGASSHTTGTKAFAGLEGTFRDAEDGVLEMHPVAQGSVDATIGVSGATPFRAELRIVAGHSHEDAAARLQPMPHPGTEPINDDLDAKLRLAIDGLLPFCDHDGAILAAVDSDILSTARAHYSYCWHRDGALIADVLSQLGRHGEADRYFRFAERTLPNTPAAFLQKYNPDGSVGATWHPWTSTDELAHIQEDETALVVWALCRHLKRTHSPPTDGQVNLIRRAAAFLMSFLGPTGLPLPSYDLWEERFGVHLFTCASVVAALSEAGPWVDGAGESAESILSAMREQLLVPGSPVRTLHSGNVDATPDASTMLAAILLPEAAPLLEAALTTRDQLGVPGGLCRYPGDYYFRRTEHSNPWIIATLWGLQLDVLSQCRTKPDIEADLMRLLALGGDSVALPEQTHPFTGEPLSVSPLAWSHAEALRLAINLGSLQLP